MIEDPELLLCSDDEIHTFDSTEFFRLKLCIATDDNNIRVGRMSEHFPDDLPALTVGTLGNAARVQHENISRFIGLDDTVSALQKLTSNSRRLGIVQFASESM